MLADWLTIRQAAQLAGLAPRTIERRIADGTLNSRMEMRGKRPVRLVWLESLRGAGLVHDEAHNMHTAPPTLPAPIADIPPILSALREGTSANQAALRTVLEMLEAQGRQLEELRAELAEAQKPQPTWWQRWLQRGGARS